MIRNTYLVVLGAVVATWVLGLLVRDASLLPGLLFWTAVVQGAIALCAGCDIAHANWHRSFRPVILGLHPLLLAFPLAFLAFGLRVTVYPWSDHPTAWLQPGFFVARNVGLLLLVWLAGVIYSRAALTESPRRGVLAVVYVLAFVICQSLMAFDWVMSFEYPWISTLLGGYFFIEALYLGAGLAAVVAAILALRSRGGDRKLLGDTTTFMFGFSLLWVGQFFAQYLVIWYGNIPHEVDFLYKRVLFSPLRQLSVAVLVCLFFFPFLTLLSRSAKTMPPVAFLVAAVVAAGVILERLVMLLPAVELSPVLVVLEFLILGAAFLIPLRQQLRAQAPARS
ncbi:MAG: hypothetical protein JW990_04255 [Thermoleophilia bacterium]|nr:hypothetical protein [Thermoleophilia bacterium]